MATHAGNHIHGEPRIRFNGGYWDGRNARKNPRMAKFAGIRDALDGRHFDKIYQLGVQAGYNEPDEGAPTTSDKAWKERRRLTDAPWISRRT